MKTHVKSILAKLEVRDRTQAVVWAYRTGFVDPSTRDRPGPALNTSGPLRRGLLALSGRPAPTCTGRTDPEGGDHHGA